MIPLKDIKIKSSKMRKKDGKIKIQPTDSCNSYFKRDVTSIIKKLNDSVEKEKTLESHIYSVLMKSETGKTSSLRQYLSYKFTKETAMSLADHDYCKEPLFDDNISNDDDDKLQEIKQYIHKQSCDYQPSTSSEQNMEASKTR